MYIEPRPRLLPRIHIAFQLPLILRGHRHHRNRKIRVESQYPRVRQVHPAGFRSALPANHHQRSRFLRRAQKIAELHKDHVATFFRQSDVPEVTELAWVLSTVTNMGLLERAVSYKEKRDKGIEATVVQVLVVGV